MPRNEKWKKQKWKRSSDLPCIWILILVFYIRWSILEKEPSSTSPNINDWIPSNDPGEKKLNFTDVVAKLHHDIQSDGFFTWIVAEDDHNSSQHVIQMDQVSKCAMYDFHDSTDTLKFWTQKRAINKTFLFSIDFDETWLSCSYPCVLQFHQVSSKSDEKKKYY